MAGDSPSARDNGNRPSSPGSPTSTGFNTDQLPLNSGQNYSDYDDDEASVDPTIIGDALEDNVNADKEEEQGEDLFNDDFMDDYPRMEQQDQYESLGLDDSMEDERDLDQIMADRRAAEIELDAREAQISNSRIPELLRLQVPPLNSPRTCEDALQFEEIMSGSAANFSYVDVKIVEQQSKALDHGISDDLKAFFSSPEFSGVNFELDEAKGVIKASYCTMIDLASLVHFYHDFRRVGHTG